ncbi:AAA family ATPase [Enterococcus avium]|uniref:AAA family ATPase n=1 Tax=Enterococcus avium TaxID=33945 RepID=A0ABD5FCB9_ENTAV|nr:AAA family ATPase [Enterococcus avium]MBU5366873.1 AAA family ATPase [Enterococcus avium]MDO7799675.1 AAA family ATPase [Enterococcus avium]MDT2399634.1 AAA family ATPase [Enterococcus avium]MDT2420949.1 AAA family ATPase [Enterococcus avium]MDT2436530.1 AAA family ATPase [Enterococcus avium]
MALIVLIGSQAVGKMTVGKELEKQIDGKLLFNHQTLDLFADFLGYSKDAFLLSDRTRKELFKAFVNNPETNTTKTIIFTVVIDFDSAYDIEFLQDISSIFLEANQKVYFVELVAALRERLKRNVHEERLKAKPSKRDTKFSRKEILTSARKNRLESRENEIKKLFPAVKHLKINNTKLAPEEVCTQIISELV